MPTNILDLPSYTVMGPEADRKNSRSEGMVFSLAPLARGPRWWPAQTGDSQRRQHSKTLKAKQP